MNLEASNLEHHARIVAQKDARIAELEALTERLLANAKALTRELQQVEKARDAGIREAVAAERAAERDAPFDREEYERRVGSVRRLLETFERRHPYTDNVAQRIVHWAGLGFTGEP